MAPFMSGPTILRYSAVCGLASAANAVRLHRAGRGGAGQLRALRARLPGHHARAGRASAEQVRWAVEAALAARNWSVSERAPGSITAFVLSRGSGDQATVEVT